MISTISMIRLGRTYGNNMIEMSAMNAKLAGRAARMVSDITGVSAETARETLEAADGPGEDRGGDDRARRRRRRGANPAGVARLPARRGTACSLTSCPPPSPRSCPPPSR
ncbi:hypothetical protein [Nonomuraea dietziae]|uniref:hypothetical protein n=1 Tax=Nonomuraea dietziae TaxID=65515 RepID=UPI0031D126DA